MSRASLAPHLRPLLLSLLCGTAAAAEPPRPAAAPLPELGALLRPQPRRSDALPRALPLVAAAAGTPTRPAPMAPADEPAQRPIASTDRPDAALPLAAAPAPDASAAGQAEVAAAQPVVVVGPTAPLPADEAPPELPGRDTMAALPVAAVSATAGGAPTAPALPAAAALAPAAAAASPAPTLVATAAPTRAADPGVRPAQAAPALASPTQPAPVVQAQAQPQTPPAAPAPVGARSPAAPIGEGRFDLQVSNAPAAQVFLQLAQGSPYNMLVSPEVSGTLSITLKDTSVPEAMDTLRELFGYEYRISGNRIFVYPNTVQTRLYRVNYLPGRRQGASDTRVTSSAITVAGATGTTGTGSGAGGGNANNSGNSGSGGARADDSAHVRTTSDADFWREVQQSLATLVGGHGGRSVVLNPAAGVVVVKATPAELRQVENYLKAVQLSIERQVMLEAKIVEVQLSKDAQTGINWGGFGKLGSGQVSIGSAAPGAVIGHSGNLSGADGTSIAPGVNLAAGALGRGFYGLAFQAANFAALLNFLQTQGDVQVLSSPRIATLNNQKAVLKVGSDELYVTGVTTSTTTTGSSAVSSPTVTLQPFFSGISLDVTPQIDEGGTVMLHVHPTISVVTEKNKNIDLGSLGAFKLPLAASQVNETDSIVRVRDGQIVAIGGLMKHSMVDERTGLPVVSEAPVVGGLFRQTSTVHSKRELVIMLKPTVIRDDGPWPDAPSFGQTPAAAASPALSR